MKIQATLTHGVAGAQVAVAVRVLNPDALLTDGAGESGAGVVALATRAPVRATPVPVLAYAGAQSPRTTSHPATGDPRRPHPFHALDRCCRPHRTTQLVAVRVHAPECRPSLISRSLQGVLI